MIYKLPKIEIPCGLTSYKGPPPATDHLDLTFWVVAFGRFDCMKLPGKRRASQIERFEGAEIRKTKQNEQKKKLKQTEVATLWRHLA